MVKYENDCIGCAAPGYPCLGESCRYRNVKHLYCDDCGDDVDKLYCVDDQELCEDCLLEHFETIEIED